MVDRKFTFNGSFKQGCQEAAVPPSLLALINLIMEGPTIKRQTAVAADAAALSISQLLIFNSVKRRRSEISTLARHSPERETPLPLYLAMKIHAVTRSRNLIDSMFSIGLETKQFTAPTIGCAVIPQSLDTLKQATKREYEWLETVKSPPETQVGQNRLDIMGSVQCQYSRGSKFTCSNH